MEDKVIEKESKFPLWKGSWSVYFFDRPRDWFNENFRFNKVKVVRFRGDKRADHRIFILDPHQMMTINWGNCTYNVRPDRIIPVRGGDMMFVVDGCTEPIDPYIWPELMERLLETDIKKLSDKELEKFGKVSTNARYFYTKMNNRNAEKIAAASQGNAQMMYYACLVAAGASLLAVALLMGWIDSGISVTVRDGVNTILGALNK